MTIVWIFVCLVTLMFVGLVNVNVGRCGQGLDKVWTKLRFGQGLDKVKVGRFESVYGTERGV